MKKQKPLHHHIDKKLKFRLRLYLVISFILFCLVGFDVYTQQLPWIFAILGMAIGGIIGIFASRMFHLSWDKDARKVVSRLDTVGIIVLIVYILFSFARREVISYFLPTPEIWPFSFATIAGVMIGRVIGMGRKIQMIIEEEVFG